MSHKRRLEALEQQAQPPALPQWAIYWDHELDAERGPCPLYRDHDGNLRERDTDKLVTHSIHVKRLSFDTGPHTSGEG
ncbi:MAG: hypothetical protein K8S97_08490 [Anaerolineae bacterium]|nr:hypothetical protein [Anaerolineae bacterium]